MADTPSLARQQDETIRLEAALLYANGDSRTAINTLIGRVNATNGHCDVRLWLSLLDIYQAEQLQAPFEKLAAHFSSRFHLSPPAWGASGDEAAPAPAGGLAPPPAAARAAGVGRHALLVEGSPLDIHDDKIRDVVRAAKEHRQCRIDLSRMRLDTSDERERAELTRLLDLMRRVRRAAVPTLLMGEAELMERLRRRTDEGRPHKDTEDPYWMMLFELLQWRGLEEAFDQAADRYAQVFAFCPVGFESAQVIARDPSRGEIGRGGPQRGAPAGGGAEAPPPTSPPAGTGWTKRTAAPLELERVVDDLRPVTDYARARWDEHQTAHINAQRLVRWSGTAARELASYLQVHAVAGAPRPLMIVQGVSDTVAALLEATGVNAYAQIGGRHDKIVHAVTGGGG